ncbi:hypothetical protein PPTG_23325 [Phytophthora nicotianae INRA-310]|uniref:Uncharacterized protein n=1 Tax=Phytophthora nicotianae (strain INRA-310) TaxID=761204 RepID=W2Q236_PHYN3|nr:hypothetical protein PPTG_23325 [Phytophthora nicotianae INRA-310]ETN06629.1 hypothetical protein PPTG_23325 [Phytophthora nicotianae INRA-310]
MRHHENLERHVTWVKLLVSVVMDDKQAGDVKPTENASESTTISTRTTTSSTTGPTLTGCTVTDKTVRRTSTGVQLNNTKVKTKTNGTPETRRRNAQVT